MQCLKRISREVKVTPAHRVLAEHPIEIIDFRPYIMIVILQLYRLLALRRQVHRYAPHAFRTAVLDTIAYRGLQAHDLGEFLVRAEG